MSRRRFEFALLNLSPTLWESFEHLASTFLADEYPGLRTLAGTGDRGRDAFLRHPDGEPTVVLQYSVSKDWNKKIKTTMNTITTNFDDVQVLIYVTNQKIGPQADQLRASIRRDYRVYLDVRDANWFLDRQFQSRSTEKAAEEFADPIVEPLLKRSSLTEPMPGNLTEGEARAAVVFLTMQWEDASRAKGLTKLSFEALVRAALRHTDNEQRMSRSEIYKAVQGMIRYGDPELVKRYTDAALGRLTKRTIRYWKKEDEYCLTYEERQRYTDALIELELLEQRLRSELVSKMSYASTVLELDLERDQLESLVPYLRRVLDSLLLRRGEEFVQSLAEGRVVLSTEEEISTTCVAEISNLPRPHLAADDLIPLMSHAIRSILIQPLAHTQLYLRALADGYTLFAFLRQVPDAQRAVKKLFSDGRIWLDTSAVLPLLAEMLLDQEDRKFTSTLKAARDTGMKLYVTPGVIKELYHHIEHARRCQEYGAGWRSRIPFLFSAYMFSGRPRGDFKQWTVEFMGRRQPLRDIADFLFDVSKIEERSLEGMVQLADDEFRWAVGRYWQEVHEARRQVANASRDPEVATRLAQYDVENFLGVVMARKTEVSVRSLAYQHWWLTLDRRAHRAAAEICQQEDCEPFDSPVMSYDFLINYVAVGPRRADVTKNEQQLLPLMLDMSMFDEIPEDILEVAETTRQEMVGMSERLIRREVRDQLNAAMLRRGSLAHGGLDAIEESLHEAFGD